MSEVIYRKYRSRDFQEIIGQDIIVQVIKQGLVSGNYPHAYLFAGPRGTGKTSMARIVAKALNCDNFISRGDVCGECPACLAVESGNYLDLIEIDAASNRGIEEIRQLKETINFLPTQGRHKVYIVDEVHMLTREAFNALLKTLEEPPAHVVFILATTESHKIPPTILSRVQRFDFRLATEAELTAKLTRILSTEGIDAEPGVYKMIYGFAEGSYRDAESTLGKLVASLRGEKAITSSMATLLLGVVEESVLERIYLSIASGNAADVIAACEELAVSGKNLSQFLKQLTEYMRVKCITAVKEGQDYKRDLKILNRLISSFAELRHLDDPRLTLQIALLGAIEQQSQVETLLNPKTEAVTAQASKQERAKLAEEAPDWQLVLRRLSDLPSNVKFHLRRVTPVLEGDVMYLECAYAMIVDILEQEDVYGRLEESVRTLWPHVSAVKLRFAGRAEAADMVPAPVQDSEEDVGSNAKLVESIL